MMPALYPPSTPHSCLPATRERWAHLAIPSPSTASRGSNTSEAGPEGTRPPALTQPDALGSALWPTVTSVSKHATLASTLPRKIILSTFTSIQFRKYSLSACQQPVQESQLGVGGGGRGEESILKEARRISGFCFAPCPQAVIKACTRPQTEPTPVTWPFWLASIGLHD